MNAKRRLTDEPIEVEPGKLLVLLSVLGSVVFLAAIRVLDSTEVVAVVSAVLGYAAGNGRLAAKGWQPAPLIRRRPLGATTDEEE